MKGVRNFAYSSMESVVLSDGITIINFGAFGACENLQSIVIPSSVTEIGRDAFGDCNSLISIVIPEGTVHMESQVFFGCKNLRSISLPSTLVEIDGPLANYCDNLETITVAEGNPRYVSVGNCLIDKKTKTLINGTNNSIIPSDGSVEVIGFLAFLGCQHMTSAIIPEGVVRIEHAFVDCSSLSSLYLPKSVKYVNEDAFDGINAITAVYYAGTMDELNAIEGILGNSFYTHFVADFYCSDGSFRNG